ncbi:hypothetical protein KIPB_009890 [Kipferlia bialata]|uniref:Smr domain-containing protein n=1 Tax=Kipferlia bialata TaxID=797122 RepID=A0A9K3D2Y8_9EUKA|nr:hypothetical protein KIPB_009890 [Kipferlia bialata]|eukprot:g9890.t1
MERARARDARDVARRARREHEYRTSTDMWAVLERAEHAPRGEGKHVSDPYVQHRNRDGLYIDLHGCTCEQSTRVVRQVFDVLRPDGAPQDSPRHTLRIITGQGKHSKGGKSVLRPHVESLLKRDNIDYRMETNNPDSLLFSSGTSHSLQGMIVVPNV